MKTFEARWWFKKKGGTNRLQVLNSNQSMAWFLLKSSGIDDRIDAYG